VKQILVGVQDLLDQPNPADPAQTEGYHLFIQVDNLKNPAFSNNIWHCVARELLYVFSSSCILLNTS
jgi:ubiquitin-protein ligase